MITTRTHNGYHLGDNLVHLHFLRKVAIANPDREFVHAAQWQYLKELQDVVVDVPNLKLTDFNYLTPSDSIDAWRGAQGFWYSHPDRFDFVKFHVESWFPFLADRMNVDNPVTNRQEMLFDYPAITNRPPGKIYPVVDILVINSIPGSGQLPNVDVYGLGRLATRMVQKGFSVATTMTVSPEILSTSVLAYSVTEIGYLSLGCHTILMVSTGPSWPTFNIWNQDTVKNRIILLEPERVYLSPHTIHCSRIEEAEEVLKEAGLL